MRIDLLLFIISWSPLNAARSGTEHQQEQYVLQNIGTEKSESPWRFNFSSTAPHYFSSVHSLLQQWPSTFFPNGYSIAAGEIPAFTKLYHGRLYENDPASPEWLAFDVAMSYAIMGSTRNSFIFTYQTTKPVKVMVFDGESATMLGNGQVDAQMLHVFGNITGPLGPDGDGYSVPVEEYFRAIGFCDWIAANNLGGPGWGFEGVVRMNVGFELIWCNFTSSNLRLMSRVNVTAPLLIPPSKDDSDPDADASIMRHADARIMEDSDGKDATPTSYYPLPPRPTEGKPINPITPSLPPTRRFLFGKEPFLEAQGWEWFKAAYQVYGSSGQGSLRGEERIKLLPNSILSYYDPKYSTQALATANEEQKELNLTTDGLWLGPTDPKDKDRTSALTKLMRRRRKHRLDSISVDDAEVMRQDTRRVFADIVAGNHGSQMDWPHVTEEIVQTYARDLIGLQDLLVEELLPGNYTFMKHWARKIRRHTHPFLLPFFEYPPSPRQSELGIDSFLRCKYHHTRLLVQEEGVTLSPEEETQKWAVEEVMGNICNVTLTIAIAVNRIWAEDFNNNLTTQPEWHLESGKLAEIKTWREGVEELMAWLGWAEQWSRCDKVCAWNERCYIPIWPLYVFQPPVPGIPFDDWRRPPSPLDDEQNLWQPKCFSIDVFG